jgi:AraC family transcriptional regulator
VKYNVSPLPLLTIENSISLMTTKGLIATSRGRNWKGITYDVYGHVSDIELDTPPVDHHAVGYCLYGSGRLWHRRGGRTYEGVIRTGSVIVMAAGGPRSWRGVVASSLRIRIPDALLSEAAMEIGGHAGRPPELVDVFNSRDLFIGQLAPILVSELERPAHPVQSLQIESISYLLAGHLLRHYDASRHHEEKITGLAPRVLATVIAYIEEHAHEAIALDTLASMANVSRFHFARMFKLSTGVSPMTYVEKNRIRKAQSLIKQEQLSLAAIAAEVGFADQSHFTRRFRLHVGCTPSDYATNLGIRLSRQFGIHAATRSCREVGFLVNDRIGA